MTEKTTTTNEERCTFCSEPATTKDHIPPKSLFKTSPPENLITVPACFPCNHDGSKDDEWFRNYLVSDDRIRNHPESQELINALNRSLQRPQSIGLRETMNRSLKRYSLITESGLYCGEGTALESDFTRESRVLTRIIKGLYYHELQKYHPNDNGNFVYSSNNIYSPDPMKREERFNIIMELIKDIKNEPIRIIGNDVFSYKWGVANDNPNANFWVLIFFKHSAIYNVALLSYTDDSSPMWRRCHEKTGNC
jgi:hypothetical protein